MIMTSIIAAAVITEDQGMCRDARPDEGPAEFGATVTRRQLIFVSVYLAYLISVNKSTGKTRVSGSSSR